MNKIYFVLLSVLCVSLFTGCDAGTFSASYTDPKTGSTYYGGVRSSAVADNK